MKHNTEHHRGGGKGGGGKGGGRIVVVVGWGREVNSMKNLNYYIC